jgi:CRP-like cAMP-binding protein
VASQVEIAVELASVSLFVDLSPAKLEKVGQAFEEQWFQPGERAQRQGFVGAGFHVILGGEAEWRVDGHVADRTATRMFTTKPFLLKRGDWFGELSILFGEPSISDVVAVSPLQCLVLPGQELERFLFEYPEVMYRLLLGEARRLRDPLRWK